MPQKSHGENDTITIFYDYPDIQDLTNDFQKAAKLGLTENGGFGYDTSSKAEYTQQYQNQLANDFFNNNLFKLQFKSRKKWQLDPTNITIQDCIKSILRQSYGRGNEEMLNALANQHYELLQKTYKGFGFNTPFKLMDHVFFPLEEWNVGVNNSLNNNFKPSIDLYYDHVSKSWVVTVYNQILIIYNPIDEDPKKFLIQYGLTAVLPTTQITTDTANVGFKIINMVVNGPSKFIDAFDHYLTAIPTDLMGCKTLTKVLEPLGGYEKLGTSVGGATRQTTNAAGLLKNKLENNIEHEFASYQEIIPPLKSHRTLSEIVSNISHIIAIRLPELFYALKLERPFSPPTPEIATFELAPKPPEPLIQEECFDIAAVCRGQDFSPEKKTFQNWKLGLNANSGHGLLLPNPTNGTQLAKDFGRGLRFQGLTFAGHNVGTDCVAGKLTNPNDYPSSLNCLETIIKNTCVPLIVEQTNERYFPGVTDVQISSSFEILKRAYTKQVGLSPIYALITAIDSFTQNFKIKKLDINRHLYLNKDSKQWTLLINGTINFEIKSAIPFGFQHCLEFTTTSEMCNKVPGITDYTDYQNNRTLQQTITDNFSDGFVLTQIQIKGHRLYINLFKRFFIDWVQGITFPNFILQDLNGYINTLSNRSMATKFFQEKLQQNAQKPSVKLSAAQNLLELLTVPNQEPDFVSSALQNGDLKTITENLIFFIGLKSPGLYNQLQFLHQNPLVPVLANNFK